MPATKSRRRGNALHNICEILNKKGCRRQVSYLDIGNDSIITDFVKMNKKICYNGLLLLPNYDKLFDLGYISFNPKGEIMYSHLLDKFDREAIGLTSDLHLVKFEDQHLKYLKYHNENCFLL